MKKGEVAENCYRKKGKERWKRIDIGRREKNDRRLKVPRTTNKEGEK